MRNEQKGIISGSIHDDAVAITARKFLEGKTPHIGDTVEFDDGRAFVYCSTEADLVASEMVAFATAASAEFAGKLAAAAIGATSVVLDLTSVAIFGGSSGEIIKDDLAGGYITFSDDAGEGYIRRIKANTVQDADAKTTLTLWEPIKIAVTTATDCVIAGPKYRKVVEGAVALSTIGAAMVLTSASSDAVEQCFWVQNRGPAACLGAATIGLEVAAAASGAVANSAEAGSGEYDRIVGTGLATTSNGTAMVDLRL